LENPLLKKLESIGCLSPRDRSALNDICEDVRNFPARTDIISEGDRPGFVHLVLSGWAARYKIIRGNGARQITAFLIPGDFCDLHITILKEMDHGITSITPTRVACIPEKVIESLPEQRPSLTQALWWSTLVDEAILREWLVSAGRRTAYQALAHLFCELHVRLCRVGLVRENVFDVPLTQEELADALGLTSVHTNRVLQRLRREGLIELEHGILTIQDSSGLCKVAGFDPRYLHAGPLSDD
jgi:CRP-like cAMP-binding protein